MKFPSPIIEIIAKCINNDGESFGVPVATKLTVGAKYCLKNIAKGSLYGDEPICDVYDEHGNKVVLNEHITKWKIEGRFALIVSHILN